MTYEGVSSCVQEHIHPFAPVCVTAAEEHITQKYWKYPSQNAQAPVHLKTNAHTQTHIVLCICFDLFMHAWTIMPVFKSKQALFPSYR